jgi:hypothetical protein
VNDNSKESREELRKKKMQREACRKRACWLSAATMEEARMMMMMLREIALLQERGEIYFFYRPKVSVEEPHSRDDVQHMYLVLRPEVAAGERGAVEEKQSSDSGIVSSNTVFFVLVPPIKSPSKLLVKSSFIVCYNTVFKFVELEETHMKLRSKPFCTQGLKFVAMKDTARDQGPAAHKALTQVLSLHFLHRKYVRKFFSN